MSDSVATTSHADTRPNLLLSNRNFALLWAAYGVSALGDHLSEMGLLKTQEALSAGVTDVTRRQAVMTFVFMLPFCVLGPVCGWLADRLPRKWIMISADLVRAFLMFSLLGVLYWLFRTMAPNHPPNAPLPLSIAVMPLALIGVFAAFFSPARSALLPTLIRPDQLVRANALTSGLGMIATIISAVVGGYLVDTVGVRWNFRIDALTFVASALLLLAIRPPAGPTTGDGSHAGLTAIVDGFRFVRGHRRVAEVLFCSVVVWTAASIIRSIIPAIVKMTFGGSYTDVGLYQGLLGIGIVVGSILLALMGDALRSGLALSWSLKLAGVAGGLLTAAISLKLGGIVCGAAIVLIGTFGAGVLVSVNALLQRMVPNRFRGRVFGVNDLFSMAGLLLATGLLGIPRWPQLDRHIGPILALTSAALLAVGVWTTLLRLQRGRFGRAITFWKNLNEFYCRLVHRARRDSICTVPLTGPVIVAANHTSSLDPFVLIALTPNRNISFLIAREFARIPFFRRLVEMIECVPVNRTGTDVASIRAALRHLASGRALAIFPQGRIQRPDEPIEIREGVGMLALRSGAVVVPAFISGVAYSDSVVVPLLRRQRAVVRFGPSVDLSKFRGREHDRAACAEAAAAISDAIFALAPS